MLDPSLIEAISLLDIIMRVHIYALRWVIKSSFLTLLVAIIYKKVDFGAWNRCKRLEINLIIPDWENTKIPSKIIQIQILPFSGQFRVFSQTRGIRFTCSVLHLLRHLETQVKVPTRHLYTNLGHFWTTFMSRLWVKG